MQYSERGERGYPWFSFHPSNRWKLILLVSLIILAASVGFFVWGTHVSNDMGGDSFVGLVFAIASTVFMLMATVAFSLRRRTRKHQRAIGELNNVLNWHVCFGVIALVMVFLHAFGNLNPRTGTYALYGMIALVISGVIGRILDRIMPRLIAQEARKALTTQGEDRIESLLEKIATNKTSELRNLPLPQTNPALSGVSGMRNVLQDTWDMAYVSPERNPLPFTSQGPADTIEEVQQAFAREKFFRYVIRYWRIFHIILAVVTVGLTLWHIEYALSLVIPALQKFGFGYLLPWP